MSPEEKKAQLKEEFEKRKKCNKTKEFKSFSDLNIRIEKEVVEEWKNNRY